MLGFVVERLIDIDPRFLGWAVGYSGVQPIASLQTGALKGEQRGWQHGLGMGHQCPLGLALPPTKDASGVGVDPPACLRISKLLVESGFRSLVTGVEQAGDQIGICRVPGRV